MGHMKLIVGNWKMYPKTVSEARRIFAVLKKRVGRGNFGVKIVICPSTLYLATLFAEKGTARVFFGAQDAFWENDGAHTGENSPTQLHSAGVTYVILGHSERRASGETDAVIALKARRAIENALTVILCVGEKDRDHSGAYFRHVGEQLRASLSRFPKGKGKALVVAYEPVWAIGVHATGVAAPSDFHEMSIFIRRHLVEYFGKKSGFSIPILYGGSVDEGNAAGFLKEGGADGLLVGRASLDPKKFSEIIRVASASK